MRKKEGTKYFVSRQRYWPDGENMVEIAVGGLDYANPDMLGVKYKRLGEGLETRDPREAAEAAIRVYEAWKNDSPDEEIEIGHGCTMGFTMPFDGSPVEEIQAWAEKAYEKLPKCVCCGELLGETTYGDYYEGEYCCSERCAEKCYAPPPDECED